MKVESGEGGHVCVWGGGGWGRVDISIRTDIYLLGDTQYKCKAIFRYEVRSAMPLWGFSVSNLCSPISLKMLKGPILALIN
jgi:hypothetical protein